MESFGDRRKGNHLLTNIKDWTLIVLMLTAFGMLGTFIGIVGSFYQRISIWDGNVVETRDLKKDVVDIKKAIEQHNLELAVFMEKLETTNRTLEKISSQISVWKNR